MGGGIGSRTTLLVFIVAALMIAVLLPFSGTVAASADSSFLTGSNAWAYGGIKTINVNSPTSNGTASGSAYYGQATVLDQQSGPDGTFAIEAQHTTGAGIDVTYCSPSCTATSYYEVVWHYHVWENITAFANLTNDASVATPSGSSPALGLLNSHSDFAANLTEFLEVQLHVGKITTTYSRDLSVQVAGTASINFSSSDPLGLIPMDVSSISSWSDSAPYSATWTWAAAYSNYSVSAGVGHLDDTSFAGNGTIPNGTMNLSGANSGSTITLGGKSLLVLSIAISGTPFDVRDGFILVPAGGDLFGNVPHDWSASQAGVTTTQLSNIDYSTTSNGHVGILATRQVYTSAPITANASGSDSINQAQPPGLPMLQQVGVQGSPESVNQATQNQQCLTADSCVASAGPSSPLREIFVALAVTALVALVLALVIQRRRQLPPPVYPNAQLYPVGSPMAPGQRAARTPTEPTKDSETDPLGNLW
jgi:MYXO-CTERM domain-containing protein